MSKPENNCLSEIRQEYKNKKQKLNQYDTFIDRHQGLVTALPLTLSFIGLLVIIVIMDGTSKEGINYGPVPSVVGILSIIFLLVSVVLAFITGYRKSAKSKLKKQLKNLEQEVATFQKQSKIHEDISRDELGLWRDIEQNNTKSHHKAIGITVIIITLAVLLTPFIVAYRNNQNTQETNAKLAASAQIQSNQAKCLNAASSAYQQSWNAADTDGDGKLSYSDGATSITTSYYDAVISCYRTYKTDDSGSYIADYQDRRQQEVDQYNAWLQAVGNAASASHNSYSSSLSCSSSSIGSTVYTHCY